MHGKSFASVLGAPRRVAHAAQHRASASPRPIPNSEVSALQEQRTTDGGAAQRAHAVNWRAHNAHAPMLVWLKPCEQVTAMGRKSKRPTSWTVVAFEVPDMLYPSTSRIQGKPARLLDALGRTACESERLDRDGRAGDGSTNGCAPRRLAAVQCRKQPAGEPLLLRY